jgi:UDP-N-acetyl-D-glucosamine dehydrogenase
MESVPLSPSMIASYDCVLVATHHAAYDWQQIADHAKLIVDTRNALANAKVDPKKIVKA